MNAFRQMNRVISVGLTIVGLTAYGHGTTHAATMTFTDQAAWEAVLLGATFLTETFDGPASSFAPGSTTQVSPVSIEYDFNDVGLGGGAPPDNVGLTGAGELELLLEGSSDRWVEIGIARPNMIGVAFLGLEIQVGENNLDLEEIGFDFGDGNVLGFEFLACEVVGLCNPMPPTVVPSTPAINGMVPFIGFVFDGPLNDFDLDNGNDIRNLTVTGSCEPFLLDGLIVAEAPVNVPEPGTLALFGVGLAGLRWRR